MNKNIQVGYEFLSSHVSNRTCEITGIEGSMVSYQFRNANGILINPTKHVDEFVRWYHVPDEVSDETTYTLLRVRSDLVTKKMMMLAESSVKDNGDKLQVTKHRDFGSVTPSEALSELLPNKLGPKTIVEISGAKVSRQVKEQIAKAIESDRPALIINLVSRLPDSASVKIHKIDPSNMSPIVTSEVKRPWSFKSWLKSWVG